MLRAGRKKSNKPSKGERAVAKAREKGINDAMDLILGVTVAILLDKYKWKNNLDRLDVFIKEFNKIFGSINNGNLSPEDIFNYVEEKSGYNVRNL